MAAGSPISNRNAAARISTAQPGPVKKMPAQTDSDAEDVAGLVTDFNALLAKLRTAGLLTS